MPPLLSTVPLLKKKPLRHHVRQLSHKRGPPPWSPQEQIRQKKLMHCIPFVSLLFVLQRSRGVKTEHLLLLLY